LHLHALYAQRIFPATLRELKAKETLLLQTSGLVAADMAAGAQSWLVGDTLFTAGIYGRGSFGLLLILVSQRALLERAQHGYAMVWLQRARGNRHTANVGLATAILKIVGVYRLHGRCGRLAPPPPVSKWICAIVVAIGAHQHRKHRVFSAWLVGMVLWSIRFII
jgi:hypothetical protein